jgi:DNA-binding transcriptional ArsR family regulator
MHTPQDHVFRSLADPTRRAIFEHLCRDGEHNVRELTDLVGVSQPAVSKHLGRLRLAGLVHDRRAGRETHYSARPQCLAPLIDWMSLYEAFGREGFDGLEPLRLRPGRMDEHAPVPVP